jgi:hypothetical protein
MHFIHFLIQLNVQVTNMFRSRVFCYSYMFRHVCDIFRELMHQIYNLPVCDILCTVCSRSLHRTWCRDENHNGSNATLYISIMKPMWCIFHSIYWESRGLYMFQALLVHPQEELHKRHLVCCVHIMSVGCGTVAEKLATVSQPIDTIHTQCTKCRL